MTSHIRDKSKDQVKGSAEILSLLETYFPDISEAAVESRRAAYRAAEKAEEQRLAIIAQKRAAEAQHAKEARDARLAAEKAESERQRFRLLVAVCGAVIAIAFFLFN
jgi:hypothetical protein